MVTTRLTMLRLGYLGLVPFLFSLLLIVSDNTLFNLSGQQFFIAYSAVILSFLSGVLWGNGIDHYYHRLSRNILVLSNLFVLLAWGGLVTREYTLHRGNIVARNRIRGRLVCRKADTECRTGS